MTAARIAIAIVLVISVELTIQVRSSTGQENPPSAQPPTTNPPPTADLPPTAERIDQLSKKAAESADLDDETKAAVAELLQRTSEAIAKTSLLVEQNRSFQAMVDAAASGANEHREQIDQLRGSSTTEIDTSLSLAELEQQQSHLEAEVTKRKQSIAAIDAETTNRTARRKEIRARLTAIENEMAELQPQLNQPPPDGEPAAETEARQMEMKSKLLRLRAEAPTIETELAAYDAEDAVDLMQLRREKASLQLANEQKLLAALQELVQARRAKEASEQISSAAEQAEGETNPQLRAIAERNVKLAEQFKALTVEIAKVEEKLKIAKANRDEWNRISKSTKEKVNAIGLTDAIGSMLRQQKSSLPNTYRYQANIDRRSKLIGDAQLQLLDLEDERAQRRNPIESTDSDPTIQQRATELIGKQSETLSNLVRTQRNYFDKLVELSNIEQQTINETSDYRNFIDERILWVRSGPPLYEATMPVREELWLLDRHQWSETFDAILADIRSNAIWYFAAVLFFFFLILNKPRFRREIRSLGATAESFSCTDMSPTIRSVSYTVLATLPWPMLIAFVAWRLSQLPTDNPIVHALAQGASSVSVVYLPLEFFRQLCQPKGLGESHFGWSNKSVDLVRRSLRSLMWAGLPLAMVIAMLNTDGTRVGSDTAQRLMFIAAMAALSVFASRVLHPQRGIFNDHLRRRPDGWASRLKDVWYWSTVIAPLMLGVMSFFGYAYTAFQLAWRAHGTVVLLAVLATATAFFTRALLVHRRRTNMETAQQRRAARQESGELTVETADIPTAEELRSQIAQSRSLLRTVMLAVALIGIWMTWVDVLPALGFLEQRPLWSSIKTVSEMTTNDAGDAQFETHDIIDPVSIADIIFAVIVAIGTLLAAKNIPGLLEIAVLKKLPIEHSVRYAIETVVSYIIVLVGLIVACSAIGIHWKQVQWMAAALTFGLAFGLQEMFANFVAGIIILIERPVRVGDIVTIDDVTGTVTRVQIRATTITNWDRKDYLVPNKDFITGRVLNWTLSNRFNRIVIPVGVAYGSDKDETVRQVLRVAIEHPKVVDDPAPTVTFEEFANSSLNYVLRCYISLDDMSSRMKIVHELNTAIDDAFRKADIEIPFPQQDLHLRSVDPDAKLG